MKHCLLPALVLALLVSGAAPASGGTEAVSYVQVVEKEWSLVMSRTSAISAWGTSKASWSTKTARSGGVSCSIMRRVAKDTDSRRSTVSSGSSGDRPVPTGSGSQGPT